MHGVNSWGGGGGAEHFHDVTIFVTKMVTSSSMVQSTVDHVVTEASNLFSDVIDKLKRKMEVFLESKNIGDDDIERQNLLRVFDQFQNPLA